MRKEYEANEALAQACAQRRNDWTTPAPQRRKNDPSRIERSHKMADLTIVAILAGSLVGLVRGFFG